MVEDDANLEKAVALANLGFDMENAVEALNLCRGDVDLAFSLLIDGDFACRGCDRVERENKDCSEWYYEDEDYEIEDSEFADTLFAVTQDLCHTDEGTGCEDCVEWDYGEKGYEDEEDKNKNKKKIDEKEQKEAKFDEKKRFGDRTQAQLMGKFCREKSNMKEFKNIYGNKKKINRKAQREKKFYKSKCSEDKTQDQLRRKFCLKKECVVSAERLKITEEKWIFEEKLKKEIKENRRKFKKWYKFKKFRKIDDKWRNLKEEIWK
ncbi:unnamed protein product [Blepharisma stoltei]|uniref:UBA domain-containing protein n=1 Tax=Blepharisma stoltei TaxID=1481888 RepID=A0AAU9J178_9CILI|nr:unnamed protein product [Blepharisma stoltei]